VPPPTRFSYYSSFTYPTSPWVLHVPSFPHCLI
jgi:hypothetical protein